jgi:hypothetical protein
MTGKPVVVGPFSGGLNNVSVSGEAKDSEVVDLINMEVVEDNSLASRPPFQYVAGSYVNPDAAGGPWKILGVYRFTDIEWYLIVVKPTGATTASVLAYQNADFTAVPINIKDITSISTNIVTAFVQMDDIAYFSVAPSSSISGFSWKKGGVTTDIAAMKKGNCMVSFKNRLWVAGNNQSNLSARLYFSKIDGTGYHPDQWDANDYTDIAAGEGGFITALYALNSSILIFKNDGTWRFSYPSAPSNGQVDKISGSIGAANSDCVLEFENYVYVYDQGRMYELVGNTMTHLNRFVKFASDSASTDSKAPGVSLSLFNRRIVIRYFNNLYVYSIDTRSWSQWRSPVGIPNKMFELPADSNSTDSSVFIAATAGITATLGQNEINSLTDAYRSYISSYLNSGGGAGNVTFSAGIISVESTSGTTTAYLNNENGPSNFNLKVSTGYKYRLQGTLTRVAAATVTARMTYLLQNGNTTTTDIVLDLDAVDKTFTVPEAAISANLHIRSTGTYTMTAMSLIKQNAASPFSLMKSKDEYAVTPLIVEYIECYVKTKSYDYQAPAAYKKLSWWGADVKTSKIVKASLRPVSLRSNPTHLELSQYTHAQLSQGTFGNPLSFLQVIMSVADAADPTNALTENGRVFLKFKKAIRFKQLIFDIAFTSHGNRDTGPVKLHSLTTFVNPKQKVVDKVN